MHRSGFGSRDAALRASRWRRAALFGGSGLLLLGVALLALSSSDAPRLDTITHQATAVDRSCKPRPPMSLDLEPTSPGNWNATLRNAGATGDFIVWMWSETTPADGVAPAAVERKRVWSGTLQADELITVSLQYVPRDDATQVWATLENAAQTDNTDAPIQRGMTMVAGPASPTRGSEKMHVLIEEASGRRIDQTVGQGGLQ